MIKKRLNTLDAGRIGERAAADYLVGIGFRIVEMNYRVSHLEIDIIAENDTRLIFVEVKARTENESNQRRFGRPGAAVTKKKQINLVSAAKQYLLTHKTGKYTRLDVIEVYFSEPAAGRPATEISRINHIENAFCAR